MTDMVDYTRFLDTAKAAAKAAESVINRYYLQQFTVEYKSDHSPVSEADIQSEQVIRAVIQEAFPDHGIYGEELGRADKDSDYLWLVDPIDGTKSFVRGYPMFSTQIALMHRGELVVGVSNAPAFAQMAWAARGQGAYLNDQPIQVAKEQPLAQSTVSFGNIQTLAASPSQWAAMGELVQAVHRHRGYGDFFHYHLLAAGNIDAVIESDVNILDIAALSVIVHEAGGVMTDLSGQRLDLATRGVLAASTSGLHQQLLSRFAHER